MRTNGSSAPCATATAPQGTSSGCARMPSAPPASCFFRVITATSTRPAPSICESTRPARASIDALSLRRGNAASSSSAAASSKSACGVSAARSLFIAPCIRPSPPQPIRLYSNS